MKIFVGYDHRGVMLGERILENLVENGHDVNLPFEENADGDDYPDIAKAVCNEVKKNKGSMGILICGTGIGMNMVANKIYGIRSNLAYSEEEAYFSRRHEDANVLVLGAGYDDGKMKIKPCHRKALRIVDTFISTEFEGERHIRRLKKMQDIEKEN